MSDEGETLREALARWGDPNLRAELEAIERVTRGRPHRSRSLHIEGRAAEAWNEGNAVFGERDKHREALVRSFLDLLISGELIAKGIKFPRHFRSQRVRIEPALWRRLRLDFGNSSAQGDGLHIIDIRVFDRLPPGTSERPKPVSDRKLMDWYDGYVRCCISENVVPTREEVAAAGQQHFGSTQVTKERCHALRRGDQSPDIWKKRGPKTLVSSRR